MWNHSNPDKCMRVGSHILEANGKSSTNAEVLKEMRDATYATMISLKIQCFEIEPEAIDEVKEEEEFEPFDPWKGMPVIPCCTQNDSHINQVWFPPSPKDENAEATPRMPNNFRNRRSDSCPPSPSKPRRSKPSLPPVNKAVRPRSRPSSRANSAKGPRDSRSASGSCERRDVSLLREPRSAPVPRPLSSS